jgi:glutamine cyclotransferase
MKRSAAEILREYGPFPGGDHVHGVTFDGQHIWFAAGDKLNAFDPASGKVQRSIDVAAHAGTAFDGQHLLQIAEDRIQKIDPKTGRVLATIPAPGGGGDSGLAWAEGDALGGAASRPEDPSSRSPNRENSSHHRVQSRRHRRHLGRRRALARHLGR